MKSFSKTMSAKQLMKIFVPVRKMNARNGGRQSVGKRRRPFVWGAKRFSAKWI